MLFLGLIARKLMDGDNKDNHHPRPTAHPGVVGVPMATVPCNCRGNQYCPQCAQHSHSPMPMMAATPVMYPHDPRREWKYERRAMREARRAARRGYGYGYAYPAAAVPVAAPPMNGGGGYARDYYEHNDDYRAAGPSSSRARSEQRSAQYWEDDDFGMPASGSKGQRRRESGKDRRSSFDDEYLSEGQGEDLPPRYERGNWQPNTMSAEASTQGKRRS